MGKGAILGYLLVVPCSTNRGGIVQLLRLSSLLSKVILGIAARTQIPGSHILAQFVIGIFRASPLS